MPEEAMNAYRHVPGESRLIRINCCQADIEGMLESPEIPLGIILFAHGSGSSRLSPRNNYVARVLRQAGMGTLLLDLLTAEEDEVYRTRFDIALLTGRLKSASEWIMQQPIGHFPLGLFGASTGAAAAIQLSAMSGQSVSACVSRGGRPDLAGTEALEKIVAPTQHNVGGRGGGGRRRGRGAGRRGRGGGRRGGGPGAARGGE